MAINRKKLFTKRLLLLSSSSLICLMAAWVLQTLGVMINPGKFGAKVTSELILDMVVAVLVGFAGFISLRAYEEKLRNSPLVLVLTAVMLYPIVNALIAMIRDGSTLAPAEMILYIFILITGLTFVIGFIMYYIQYRQDRIGKQE